MSGNIFRTGVSYDYSMARLFKRPFIRFISLLLIFCAGALPDLHAQSRNGFDLSAATIPLKEILSGGPPRDGIPSIDRPRFVSPEIASGFLKEDDIVIGVTTDGIARAYPLRILVWHEIVNDVIGDQAVAVTYCPLCGTSMVFDALVDGRRRTFGVSGLLYQSDVLMYDRETESLWSQLAMEAVSGPAVGTSLKLLASDHMTWKAWREKYPKGRVLSTETGHKRNYRGQAYASYFSSDKTMFPVPITRRELPNKEFVLGVVIDGKAKAYPLKKLPDGEIISDQIGKQDVKIKWDATARHPSVLDSKGKTMPSVVAFWFAWQAFYPETELWTR